MIQPLKIASSHEELFADRYQRLLAWSLQLTGHDRDLAEDLLHDAFVQFTFAKPDLGAIRNLDGYLYHMLRNLHVSQIRREARNRLQQLSVIEYDSADDGLRTIDLRDQPQVEAELRKVCRYACQRKETATAASVLILRFFHGYYPSEIAQVLRASRQAVDVKLLIARREARASFESPNTLSFIGERQLPEASPEAPAHAADDFLCELRQMIFNSREGDCLSHKQLRYLYSVANENPMHCASLAHVVSCPICLGEVNRILGLPSLSERIPTRMLGRDKRTPKGPQGGGPKGSAPIISSWRRRARRVFEHKPQELCVTVNGYVQASQTVNSDLSELNLNIDLAEDISFVEVFSEQKLRLLMLSVDELPPIGPGELERLLELSDGRTLSLKLEFRSPWPTLQIAFHDPTYKEVQELLESFTTEDAVLPASLPDNEDSSRKTNTFRARWISAIRQNLSTAKSSRFWLRPGVVTAAFALLLISALLFFSYRRGPNAPITATDILQRAVASEDLIASNRDQVIHRTLRLEGRVSEPGAIATGSEARLISTRTIEIWQSAEKGVTARRLYDENGSLVAGAWKRSDGVQTIYHHGKRPELRLADKTTSIDFESVWLLDPSAKSFSSVVGAQSASVQTEDNSYLLTAGPTNSSSVLTARLVLSRSDLHATEQVLAVRQGADQREYRFIETSFERRASSSVAPAVFEPEPSLLSSAKPETRNSQPETATAGGPPPSPFLATPELEVEVLKQLDQANAFYGEQIGLSRTAEGRLRLQGIVDTDNRKIELLRALGSLKNNSAVQIQIETAAEAAERQARQRSGNNASIDASNVEVNSKTSLPAEPELRAYLSKAQGLSGEGLDQEVQRYANRLIAHARQARREAVALKQIAERFSQDDLRTLDDASRTEWRALIRQHAKRVAQELELLREDLQPMFPALNGVGGNNAPSGDSDVAYSGKELFQLTSEIDQAVGMSFSIYANGNGGIPVKAERFARALHSATSLARRF